MTFNKCNSGLCKNNSDGFWDVISVKKATQLVLHVLSILLFLIFFFSFCGFFFFFFFFLI
jgi:hypothetical protein